MPRISAAYEGLGWPEDDQAWSRCIAFLVQAMPFVGVQADSSADCKLAEPTSIDDVVQEIADSCFYAIGVPVDKTMIHELVGPLCLQIEPSSFLAKTLLRTDVVSAVVGVSLTRTIRRREYENVWGELCLAPESNPLAEVITELLESRRKLQDVQTAASLGRLGQVLSLIHI